MAIVRQTELFSQREYDLIIVGGGIYGVMLTLEAVFRRLRPLLLERNDYGGATSFNSQRIVHGGLRYLQTLDLRRHIESVQERRWFLANFPDLVKPLPCLMPLYGRGIRRNSIFRVVLAINDTLSSRRNQGVPSANTLPRGRVLNKAETVDAFPGVDLRNLKGAARWHDAAMQDSQRLVMEVLRWAASYGADMANYVEVTDLSVTADAVRGVRARDTLAGSEFSFRAPVVVNAAGPWSSKVAEQLGSNTNELFWPSLAWNLLTDQPAPSGHALAISPPRKSSPTYFLHPWKGRLLIGTGHAACSGFTERPEISEDKIETMIDDVNSSIPGLSLTASNIDRILAGFLPAAAPHSADLAVRPTVINHGKSGGPAGLISVSGVKFTTSRRVAADTLSSVFGNERASENRDLPRPDSAQGWQSSRVDFSDEKAAERYLVQLSRLIAEESVMSLQDVVFRRTDLWEDPATISLLAPRICDLFAWSDEQKATELAGLADELKIDFPVGRFPKNPESANAR